MASLQHLRLQVRGHASSGLQMVVADGDKDVAGRTRGKVALTKVPDVGRAVQISINNKIALTSHR